MHVLYEEHREIKVLSDQLMAILDGMPAMDAETLQGIGPLRQNIALVLQKHLASENDHLLTRLTPRQKESIPRFREITKGTVKCRLAYSAHVTKWHQKQILADYPAYVTDVRALIAILYEQIELEETFLYGPGLRIVDGTR